MYGAAASTKGPAAEIAEMEKMVAKYSQTFPAQSPTKALLPLNKKEMVVLLTGSTGGLGSNVLDCLIRDPSVSRIYALNRVDGKGGRLLRERQKGAFEEHGLNVKLLDSQKLVLLEGDTALDNLGLHEPVFEEIRKGITSIIHNGMCRDHVPMLGFFF
jgi:Male sterility protein